MEFTPESDGTDVGAALRYLTNAIKKKCTAFVLSDLIDVDAERMPRYEDALKVAVNRHDISMIEVYDPAERNIPDVGLVHVKDSETGKSAWVDTSSAKMRAEYRRWFSDVSDNTSKLLMKYSVDSVSIATDQDYVKGLMTFFQKR